VQRYRGERTVGDRFLLALLLHDWSSGQVDELITSIKTAAASTAENGEIGIVALDGCLPEGLIRQVRDMKDEQVEGQLYHYLTRVLQSQGFGKGKRDGMGLQSRLSAILGVTPSTISRKLKKLTAPS
jgi:transcriptional regulator of acetoin/glycerol metabolism